jgi:hypothetical protein
MIANKDKCANQDKTVCDYNEFRRLRYFHGMLLDDNDFRAEQEYHTNKRRFLNRMLYGSGVVCGLGLLGKKEGRWIEVTSGFALDCSGNEIWVPRTIRIDLANLLPPKDKGKNVECEEEEEQEPNTYYIGIRYEEKPSNPVSVYLPSGSCEERTCENSRVKEGFCIELVPCCLKKPDPEKYPGLIKSLCECPAEFTAPEEEMPLCPSCQGLENKELCACLEMEKFCEQSVPCPECCSCDKPCHVVLGKIKVDEEYRLVNICINECRSYVLTGHLLRHMLRGVFAQGSEHFAMSVGNDNIPLPEDWWQWADNPIKALCWALPYMVGGGKFKWLGCQPEQARDQDLATQVRQMRIEHDDMLAQMRAIGDKVGIPVARRTGWTDTTAMPVAGKPAAESPAVESPAAAPAAPEMGAEKAAPEKPPAAKPPKGLPK